MFTLTDEIKGTDIRDLLHKESELTSDLSQKSCYNLLFSESIESASVRSDSKISVRSLEEEWSCNVIYLQASVNVCSEGSTKLR